jgi:hypothetical protein
LWFYAGLGVEFVAMAESVRVGDGQQMDNYNLRERFAADFAADAANDNL